MEHEAAVDPGPPEEQARPLAGAAPSEPVEHVDAHDRPLGVVDRAEAARRGLLHRLATTVCRDPAGRYLVYRRPPSAPRFAGLYDVMVGGAVAVGEGYAEAAARELAEELGVLVPVRPVARFLVRGALCPYWLGLHEAVITTGVRPDPAEVAWCGWMTAAELERHTAAHPYVPDGLLALARYRAAAGAP